MAPGGVAMGRALSVTSDLGSGSEDAADGVLPADALDQVIGAGAYEEGAPTCLEGLYTVKSMDMLLQMQARSFVKLCASTHGCFCQFAGHDFFDALALALSLQNLGQCCFRNLHVRIC
jgi:hypothetical protein